MSYNFHLLKSSGRLNPFIDQIQSEFNNFIKKTEGILPLQDIDIVIYDNPYGTIPEIGIGAFTSYSYTIFISIDPNFPNLENSINKEFSGTLAHEIHHAYRAKYFNYGETLLEALIAEGLADHFDIEINKTGPKPWNNALIDEQLIKYKQLVKTEYFNKDYNHNNWFFGFSKDIPRWAGYTLGFKLVEDYLKKHPGQKPSSLYNLKAEEFIK